MQAGLVELATCSYRWLSCQKMVWCWGHSIEQALVYSLFLFFFGWEGTRILICLSIAFCCYNCLPLVPYAQWTFVIKCLYSFQWLLCIHAYFPWLLHYLNYLSWMFTFILILGDGHDMQIRRPSDSMEFFMSFWYSPMKKEFISLFAGCRPWMSTGDWYWFQLVNKSPSKVGNLFFV